MLGQETPWFGQTVIALTAWDAEGLARLLGGTPGCISVLVSPPAQHLCPSYTLRVTLDLPAENFQRALKCCFPERRKYGRGASGSRPSWRLTTTVKAAQEEDAPLGSFSPELPGKGPKETGPLSGRAPAGDAVVLRGEGERRGGPSRTRPRSE